MGAAVTIMAAILLAFAADLLVVGHIRHARDQQTAFADLRGELANGTAPVNQLGDTGTLQPLGTALGVLEIPQIGLREVFFEGTTSSVLLSGPGHRRDTAMPGQAGTSVIMGRKAAFGGPFNYLHELQPRTVFWVWTGQGKSAYRVTGIRRAGDPVPAALGSGQGRLTLVTAEGADYMPTGTLRVDATLVQTHAEDPATRSTQPVPSGPRPLGALQLPIAERPMRGDPTAWLDVGLAAVALFLVGLGVGWARMRWGRWQAWLAGTPPLFAAALLVSDHLSRLLPNLL
jgi:LPXTG-site transpeptidase (sortase) family protein